MSGPERDRLWPWWPFALLSLASALLPGFALGAALAAGGMRGGLAGPAWQALAQAHAHAQLAGWGGAMILGVALNFLPRLAAAAPPPRPWAAAGFALFALGLAATTGARVAAARTGAGLPTRAAWAAGAALELAGALVAVGLLARALAAGPGWAPKRAFAALRPLFAGACASLLLGEAAWAAATWRAARAPAGTGAAGQAARALDPWLARAAEDVTLLGFVLPVSLAMSARLFPLFFRTRPAPGRPLRAAGALLLAGAWLAGLGGLRGAEGTGLRAAGALCAGAGALLGTAAVQVFAPRVPFPGDRGGYRVTRDPAGLGALVAYVWAVLGGAALALAGLEVLVRGAVPGTWGRDLAVHALGAGFMTLLILAVAPVMLPGFAGGRLRSPRLVAWSVALGALAAALRTAPGWAAALGAPAGGWALPAVAAAGAAGLAAVALLAVNLGLSLRPAPAPAPGRQPQGRPGAG